MLTSYVTAAMKKAKYKLLDDGTYFGEIPRFEGVWANARNLDACCEELQEVLEGWLVIGLQKNAQLPVVGGINLNSPRRTSRVA